MTAPDWTGALCAQADPESWHPTKGQSVRQPKAICARCPLLQKCRDYGLAHPELQGILGGLTAKDRKRIRAEQRRAA